MFHAEGSHRMSTEGFRRRVTYTLEQIILAGCSLELNTGRRERRQGEQPPRGEMAESRSRAEELSNSGCMFWRWSQEHLLMDWMCSPEREEHVGCS